ncbi:hypothetical protein [Psychrobacter sp.]|uniref:hypothetical protein n=1 Tax=Psychrobacter sp. TaxID=56811 RepID=UPI003F9C1FCF
MQFSIIPAFAVFIGSYLPLALILAVQDIPSTWWQNSLCNVSKLGECSFIPFGSPYLSIFFLLITFISVILSNTLLKKISHPYEARVDSFKAIPNDIINYVFPYVVAFMGLSYDTPEKLLGFAVFLIWMFAITYKSGQIMMNPLLLMFGWKLYEANIHINGHDREVRILSKSILSKNSYYRVQNIQNVYITKE